MIPILYEKTERSFASNGICRLPDCGMCQVTEERNGVYECQFTYPVTGRHYAEITEGRIIYCTHDETGDAQPFDIYARTEPIEGVVTFFAHHISYRLGRVILRPFTSVSCPAALAAMPNNTYNTCPFTFWTDKTTAGTYTITTPTVIKEALGGSQGSILDVYGKGEYEWDKFTVKLHLNRGVSTGVTIRYGVNLTGYNRDLNYWECYNACVPFWRSQETNVLVCPGVVYAQGYDATNAEPVPMDLSTEWETQPTLAQVQAKAEARMANNRSWLPSDNITVSFVPLWQTEEYAGVAPLQRVRLCDRVNVIYGPGGVRIDDVEVVKTVYNVLLDRYDSMELGAARASFAQMLKADITDSILVQVPTISAMDAAIEYATDLIKGGMGGHLVINTDADGHPNELLIMDADNTTDAVNVWRFNLNGLGHSSNGYEGPYSDIAITMDGRINADMITTGTLNAARVSAGVLSGVSIDIGNGNFTVSAAGEMIAQEATINGTVTAEDDGSSTGEDDDEIIPGIPGKIVMKSGELLVYSEDPNNSGSYKLVGRITGKYGDLDIICEPSTMASMSNSYDGQDRDSIYVNAAGIRMHFANALYLYDATDFSPGWHKAFNGYIRDSNNTLHTVVQGIIC